MVNLKSKVYVRRWNATRNVPLAEVYDLFWCEVYRERLERIRMAMRNQMIEENED